MNTLRHGSSLGTRDPFKSPEGSTSLCSPKQFPRGLKFSFKSPFPVLLTSLWGWIVAPAGSSSWGSRRPGLAWASTAGNLPRGRRPFHAERDHRPAPSCHAEGSSRPPWSGGRLLDHSLHRQQAPLELPFTSPPPGASGEFPL